MNDDFKDLQALDSSEFHRHVSDIKWNTCKEIMLTCLIAKEAVFPTMEEFILKSCYLKLFFKKYLSLKFCLHMIFWHVLYTYIYLLEYTQYNGRE